MMALPPCCSVALAWTRHEGGGTTGALESLLVISGGGILLGLLTGALGLIIAGRTGDDMVEAAVTGVAAYGAFLLAEYLHTSGVLATVSAGLLMGSAGLRGGGFGISPAGRAFVRQASGIRGVYSQFAGLLLIGLTVARIPFVEAGWAGPGRRYHPGC